jgi:hypothetical protein
MHNLSDLTGLWPSVADFARDIGVKPSHAHTMLVRGNIPVVYWPKIIQAADGRGIKGVTSEAMMNIHTEAAEPAQP